MNTSIECKKCGVKFGRIQNLEKHMTKKIPCNRILNCDKCGKVFNHIGNLKTHKNRKTPCEPIQGDPTKKTPDGSCHFCYKKFKSKYSLKNHYNICKIKNGGMALLFKKVELLEKENKDMKEQIAKGVGKAKMIINNGDNNQNIETQNISNHINTTFNFTLINFGEGQEEIVKILSQEIEKLGIDGRDDIPYIKQVKDRIIGLVMKVHRNPEQKELQNVYVTDVEKPRDNAFMYEDNKWKITDWDKLNKTILRNLYTNIYDSKLHKKEDKMEVMKHMFVAGGCGDRDTIQKMSDEAVSEMYLEIGNELNFKTISL